MTRRFQVDFHDDPVAVLRLLSPQEQAFVKTAQQVPDRSGLLSVPDNRFALVVRDGEQIHRRFLCSDPVSTLLSVAALDAWGPTLSENMQKVASYHLGRAARMYGVRVPTVEWEGPADSNVVVGRLPEQVIKLAADAVMESLELANWFDQHLDSVPLDRRRELALLLRTRLEQHHLPVFGKVAHYCAPEPNYGHARGALLARQHLVGSSGEAEADFLSREAERMGSGGLVAAIRTFDQQHGLEKLWGGVLPDPWASVFTDTGLMKAAAESPLLLQLQGREDKVREVFGDEFLTDLRRDPDAVVRALPRPEREVLEGMLGA